MRPNVDFPDKLSADLKIKVANLEKKRGRRMTIREAVTEAVTIWVYGKPKTN